MQPQTTEKVMGWGWGGGEEQKEDMKGRKQGKSEMQ